MTTTTTFSPYVASDANRHIVLVYAQTDRRTYYLGLEGCQLSALTADTREFRYMFEPFPKTPLQFANAYTSSEQARRLLPISGAAYKVLRAILAGQAGFGLSEDVSPQLTDMEKEMAEAPKRSPDGPVAQIHTFLDKRVEAIKAGRTSRKDLIDQLVAKGFNQSTVVTQCGVWGRTNGVQFARPAAAAAAKKASRKKTAEGAAA